MAMEGPHFDGKKIIKCPLLPLLTLARSLLSFRTRPSLWNPLPSDQRPALFAAFRLAGEIVRGPTNKECARSMREHQ